MQGNYNRVKFCPQCNGLNQLQFTHCMHCGMSLENAREGFTEYQQNIINAQNYNQQPMPQYQYNQPQNQYIQPQYYQQPYYQSEKKTNIGMYIGIIAAIMIIAGVFMPYVKINAFGVVASQSLWDLCISGENFETPIIYTIGILLVLYNLIKGKSKIVIIDAVVLLVCNLFMAFFGIQYNDTSELDIETIKALTSYGIGFYFILIGTTALIISGIIISKENNN